MSDSNAAGTSDEGTQSVEDTATSTGTVDTGTPSTEATGTQADDVASASQPANPVADTDTPAKAPVGTQDPTQAKPGEDTANQWDNDANPYRKRFNDTLSHAQRQFQELQTRDRLLAESRAKIAEFEQARTKEAERAQLKRWNAGHPEHAKFRSLNDRAANYNRLLSKADTPEKKLMLRELMGGEFSTDEIQELDNAEQDRKQILQDFTADPRGFFRSNVQDAIREALTQYDTYQATRMQVQNVIGDPANAKLIEAYAPDMQRIMDPQVPSRDKAFEFARIKAENDALKAQLGKEAKEVATADAREALLNGKRPNATSSQRQAREPANANTAMERLQKRGIKPGDSRFETAMADEMLGLRRH